ncbi:AgrD family cyclic lactone autoinducer peptide [Clostridium estertheticum]|nr:cyclic lactone autoinducer peptide [Clostridium estertheticum]MBU3074453.1 cyclic lactone autoinducer peptide [Clostridium estertheticum]MBU3164547.1 cyclic lactone autoinducer peptide [Clostridium estertheticum]MBW9154382.1 cyclic lactone autoinducer peptide [Clostridium estertheticum]WLC85829.1 cyclic lactone autoinducer peptide [Clostridium estertheticum]
MKKLKKSNIVTMLGVCLISFAGIITNSASTMFWGEVEPPKSLLNK